MDGKWGKLGMLALLLGILAGCRTPPPVVKPEKTPEVLNPPPQEARFDNPGMPKQAFERDDPMKRWRDRLNENADVTPARATFGGPGGPGGPGMMR